MYKCKNCGELLTKKNNMYVCDVCGSSYSEADLLKQEKAKETKNSQEVLQEISKAKSDLAEKCAKSVVKIYCELDQDSLATGTGWRGSKDYIITNAHVVEGDEGKPSTKQIKVEYSDYLNLGSKQTDLFKVCYFDRVEDIAILKPIKNSIPDSVPVLNIVKEPTHIGELVFTIGNPLHYKFTYIEGTVANPDYVQEGSKRNYSVLQTTLTLNHGNSGGPVFNSKGDVVGMTTFSECEIDNDALNLSTLLGKQTYTEIKGYGFCVAGKAITDAIKHVVK